MWEYIFNKIGINKILSEEVRRIIKAVLNFKPIHQDQTDLFHFSHSSTSFPFVSFAILVNKFPIIKKETETKMNGFFCDLETQNGSYDPGPFIYYLFPIKTK